MQKLVCDMCGKETTDYEECSKYYNPIIHNFDGPNMDLCPDCKEEYLKVVEIIFQKTSEAEKKFKEQKRKISKEYMKKFREERRHS